MREAAILLQNNWNFVDSIGYPFSIYVCLSQQATCKFPFTSAMPNELSQGVVHSHNGIVQIKMILGVAIIREEIHFRFRYNFQFSSFHLFASKIFGK